MSVRRFDKASIGKSVRLDNGWLRTDACLTRVGVFPYRQSDGSVRNELRLPEDVFHKDALASFDLVPVTLDHPPVGVLDSTNTKKFQKGSVSNIHQDGANVAGTILLTDDEAIEEAMKGRKQVSCGYTCDLDKTPGITDGIPGVANGQRYDAIQRNIRGNHVALVYRGRAGESASLRMDDAEMVHEDAGFNEEDHPRDEGGKFSTSGGSKKTKDILHKGQKIGKVTKLSGPVQDEHGNPMTHSGKLASGEMAVGNSEEEVLSKLYSKKFAADSEAKVHSEMTTLEAHRSSKVASTLQPGNAEFRAAHHHASFDHARAANLAADIGNIELSNDHRVSSRHHFETAMNDWQNSEGSVQKSDSSDFNPEHMNASIHAYNVAINDEEDEGEDHDHEGATAKAKAAAMVVGADEKEADEVADHVNAIHLADCEGSRKDEEMKKIKLDGVDVEVADPVAVSFEKLQEAIAKERARADAAEEKLKEVEEKAKKVDINAMVKNRLQVIHSAEKLLGKESANLKLDSMSDIEIKKAAVIAKYPSAKDKLTDDAYINARFDAALESLTEDEEEGTALNPLRNPAARADGGEDTSIDLDSRRKKMIEDGRKFSSK